MFHTKIIFENVANDTTKQGCGRAFKQGQWAVGCGEYQQGSDFPLLCVECGGNYKLKKTWFKPKS